MTQSLKNNPLTNRLPGAQTLSGGIQALLDLHALQSEKMIPASVVAYDRANNVATVQPMIMMVDTNDNARLRRQIAQVPVLSLGGGGFHINFPLKPGDLGWILAADRDISLFMDNLQASPPTTMRKHKFNDSWFVPDVYRKYTINGADTNAMVIQSVDGATRVSISNGTIEITAPTAVKIDTPLATFTHDVKIKGNLVVDVNATVTGQMAANGGFNATGGGNLPCVLPQSTTIGGIIVYGHGHTQTAVNGQRTSGGMVS